MALLKLDLHLFHKDARKLSLITVDVQKDVTVQHVLQQISSIYEISCDEESSGIALFSEGFFIHPSLPSSALLVLPGTLLVRPVLVIPEPLDGKGRKKRRIELINEDLGVCCPSTSHRNASLAVLSEGQGHLASLPACDTCCHVGKDSHILDSATEIRSVKDVLDDGPLLRPPRKKRKKCTIDFHEKNNEFGIQLHSTPKIFPKDDESVSDEHNMPKKKNKKKRKKGMTLCAETIEEETCDNVDGSYCRMSEDECAEPPERKSVKKKKKVNKTVESTECSDLDGSNCRMSEDECAEPPEKKSVKNNKKKVNKTVESTKCSYLDGSNCRMSEDECAEPPERKSVKNNKKKVNKTVESTECCDLDGSKGRMSVEEKSHKFSKKKSVRKENTRDFSMTQSTSVLDEIDGNSSKMEKSFVENIKRRVQTQGNDMESKSILKSAASSSNGRIRQHQDDNVCLQQTKGHFSSQVYNSDVVYTRTETLLDCSSESDHSHSISNDGESSNETNSAVISSTNKRKRKRKHNKRLKREKKRLKALFLGDGTGEMPVEQQHQRQKDMQQMVKKYLKRDSAMLATDAIDSKERREYETQLKSVPKLSTKPGKVKIIEGNKFKREKCGIVTFQGKKFTFHSSVELANNIHEEASVTVSTNTKVESHSNSKEDVNCGQEGVKSTLQSFLDRRLQKTLMQNDSTPSILSNVNSITKNQSQSELQLGHNEVKVAPKDPFQKILGTKEAASSSSSVNPLGEGSHLPTSGTMIRSCAKKSVKCANPPVPVDEQFSILRDIENSGVVSVFKYKRRKTNTSHREKVSVDELSDDSTPLSMSRRKKTDDGVRFPFRAPPNPTPFSPESDEIKSDFFFLSSIENPIEPLVYYRYNAYGKDVSSLGKCKNDGLIKDASLGYYSATQSEQTTDLVSNEVDSFMTRPASIIVHDVKPKYNGTSILSREFSVDGIVHHNGVAENDASQSILSDYVSCGTKFESQSQFLNGSQFCSAQEMSSARLPYGAENTEVLEGSSCSASGLKDSNNFTGDSPCLNSLEKSIVSSLTKLDYVEPIQSPPLSYECEAMAGAASVHTGKLQCLQPMSNKQSKGFKPRVYSAMGSLLQQLRNKASTEEKASANFGEYAGVLNGVKVTALPSEKPRTLTEVPIENNAAFDVHCLESSQDRSNISCSSPSTERESYLNGIGNENRYRLSGNSKLEKFHGDVIPKKERGKRIRKRKGKEAQNLVSAVTDKKEQFQSLWDVTPEEYNARNDKNTQNSFFEIDIQNHCIGSNSEDHPGLPSVLSNIDVANLPQVCGMPHVGDIVFFYIDDASFTTDHCPTMTPLVNGNRDTKTSGDSGAFLNGCFTTNIVNPLTRCSIINMTAQRTCLPTSNGEQQFVSVVGKVLTVSEGVVTLQLIGNSSDNASVSNSEPVIDLVECNGPNNISGVEKTVLWSSVVCPKLVFP